MSGWLTDEELTAFRADWDAELKTAYTLKRLTNGALPYANIETTLKCNVVAPGSSASPHITSMWREILATTKAERLIVLSYSSQVQPQDKIVVGAVEYKVIEAEVDPTFLIGKVVPVQRMPS